MDAAAVRDELALVGWDAWALERGLVLRALAPPPGGYALERDDGACVAWLDTADGTELAPEAVTSDQLLGLGRAARHGRRLVLFDEGSGAHLVTVAPYALRRSAVIEPSFGERLRLAAPFVGGEWRLRDGGRNVLARAQSRKGLERMRLAGDAQAGMTLPVLIAVIFAILLSDQAAAGLAGGAAGAPAGG